MGEPSTTALMCAFNAEATIEGAVASLLGQTDDDVEVLVVDDASQDSTQSILRRQPRRRVRVLRNESRLGIAASRNRGVAEARGRVLLIADADDESPRGRVKAQVEALSASGGLALVGGYAEAVDEDGSSLAVLRTPERAEEMRARRFDATPLLHCTLAVRTEALRAVGGYREKFVLASDYDLLCRLVERFDAVTIPSVFCRYRMSRESSTVRFSAASAVCVAAAKRFARERSESGRDSYADWAGVPPSGLGVNADAGTDYHLWAGKTAASNGNPAIARRHFAAAGLRGAPYLAATLAGSEGYRRIQALFGSRAA